jgi:hypothetical protein
MKLTVFEIFVIIIVSMLLLYVLKGFICGVFCSIRIHSFDRSRDSGASDNELIDISNSIIGISNRIIEIKNVEIIKTSNEANSDSIDLPHANMI